MGFADQNFHVFIEVLVVLLVPYLLVLAFQQRVRWQRYLLFVFAFGNLIIDVYAVLNWFVPPLLPRQAFHMTTEALGVLFAPFVFYVGLQQEKWFPRWFLLVFACLGFLIDGYLLFTW